MPPMNEASRRELIEERLGATVEAPHRTEQLPWRDGQSSFPVVELPLDAVLLNPNSHRIKSQLMSHPDRAVVEDDPWSDEAQQIIADILRETGKFEDLKQNLDEVGQQDAGVVTREGILVNANRRATALRDLDKGYIAVAVLDPKATPQEIAELELALQMKREFKEDYSFSNRLLFIKELTDLGWSAGKIALRLNFAVSRDVKELEKGRDEVLQHLRMLAMIEQIREIAAKAGADSVPYTFFDDRRQSLIEIDEAYEKRKEKDPTTAENVKRMRMVGLLTDAGYQPLREMEEDFAREYLFSALEHVADSDGFKGNLVPLLTGNEDDEEDDNLNVDLLVADEEEEPAGNAPVDPERLLQLLAGSHDEEAVEIPSREGVGTVTVSREQVVDHLTTAIKVAADEHKSERRFENRLVAPMKKADDARHQLDLVGKKLDRVDGKSGFDWEQFDKRMAKLRRSYEALLTKIAMLRPSSSERTEASVGDDG